MSTDADSKYRLARTIAQHQYRVAYYLNKFVTELLTRGLVHDASKLEDPEFSQYASVAEEFEKHPFGTEGYFNAKEKISEAVKLHYSKNNHHPEYYPNGIDDMDLMDVVEMLCDWKAATLNHKTAPGNMINSLEYATEKYKISPQLAQILLNTIKRYGL